MKISALWLLCVLLFFCIASTLSIQEAGAYNVYNKTRRSIHVRGERCARCYDGHVAAGRHGSCPGGSKGCRGHTWISVEGPPGVCSRKGFNPLNGNWVQDRWYHYCGKEVPAHGWVTIGETRLYGLRCVVHKRNGDAIWRGLMQISCGPKDDD